MDTKGLAAALRNKAAEVRNVNVTTERDDQVLRDAADLLRVLASIADSNHLARAFGAPGDWGYDTAIGKALAISHLVRACKSVEIAPEVQP